MIKVKTEDLYVKINGEFEKLIDLEQAAKILKLNPSTMSVYLARGDIALKKFKIKNLTFLTLKQVETFGRIRKLGRSKKIIGNLPLFKTS